MIGLNEFDSSDLVAEVNSGWIAFEFVVVFVRSTELSRSAVKFVGEVVSVIVVFLRFVP